MPWALSTVATPLPPPGKPVYTTLSSLWEGKNKSVSYRPTEMRERVIIKNTENRTKTANSDRKTFYKKAQNKRGGH